MYRHRSCMTFRPLQARLLVGLAVGAVAFIAGCVPPAEEGDAAMSATGMVIAQIVGFAVDFARQLLAAYLF